jgi:colanic acid/amylovoran biosynthesis glycosyltransferase
VKIALFSSNYLALSETFIYRQLTGIRPDFQPIVICCNRINENDKIFPFSPICEAPKRTFTEKCIGKILKILSKNYVIPSSRHLNYWETKLKENNCKLIHAHFGPAGLYVLPLAKKTRLPLVVTFHGFDISKLLNEKKYVKQLRMLFKDAAKIITVSEHFRRKVIELGCPEHKVIRHYIGVPVEKNTATGKNKKNGPKNSIISLQISRFTEKKGHIYTLQAFKKVIDTGIDSQLQFVGEGDTLDSCKNLVKDLGLNDKVQFLGAKPPHEINSYLEKADIYVHHSITPESGDTEGIPISIMEAMSKELPIISTYHSGIPELVVDEKSGYLVKEKDVNDYAEKWISLIKDQSRFQSIGEFNRQRIVEHFNLDKQNEVLKDIYQDAIRSSNVL